MTESNPATPETSAESKAFAPFQQGFERLSAGSQKVASTYADIASHNVTLLQKTVLESLTEMQGLARARNPVEFFEMSSELARQQTERALKIFGEMGTEIRSFWSEALNSAPSQSDEPKRRSTH